MAKHEVVPFALADFFPYRLAVLAENVSQAVAQLYGDRFQITRAEWRVLAALGANNGMAAKDIGAYSTLDKMQVSRAVARLEEANLITRATDDADRRAKILTLTASGRALFQKIVPLARAREDYLLEDLDAQERAVLDKAMAKVLARAQGLIERG
ncbi:MarR family winged helix-turn-helix transcriptional regulator [Xanthobacter oligotrophicus]|uniref:MarR family winged helix-turn-helix transcriptional regulator n=1 Tax=Xanthobacter oligotrophicus TaxID=2607286 RepID=UPI0011F3FF98|nr:MarR family transcriptional regulator [Xanthobacter oligotrophicus]MCG5236904.1 MarR family transcriptional regulator [Xanthobacter oligotrophicus]